MQTSSSCRTSIRHSERMLARGRREYAHRSTQASARQAATQPGGAGADEVLEQLRVLTHRVDSMHRVNRRVAESVEELDERFKDSVATQVCDVCAGGIWCCSDVVMQCDRATCRREFFAS